MTTKRHFIKQFFKEKKTVGAIKPSSKFLGKKMLQHVDFEKDKIIVELGPGTGVFTDLIIEELAEDAQLYVFELNDHFFEVLNKRINDPRVHIIHDSAEHIQKHIENHLKVDAVISSLPLMNFPSKLRHALVTEAHDCLSDNGKFIQFQYTLQSKRMLSKYFNSISINFTFKNLPPAFIYTCLK